MYSLYKDPHGEKVFSTSITTQQATSSAAGERKVIYITHTCIVTFIL